MVYFIFIKLPVLSLGVLHLEIQLYHMHRSDVVVCVYLVAINLLVINIEENYENPTSNIFQDISQAQQMLITV